MDPQKPEITIEQYTHELEKALIFMCECYKDARDMVAGCRETDDKQTDDRYFGLYMHFPQIQGIGNLFAMEKIADLRTRLGNREGNLMSMEDIYQRMKQNRTTMEEIGQRARDSFKRIQEEKNISK